MTTPPQAIPPAGLSEQELERMFAEAQYEYRIASPGSCSNGRAAASKDVQSLVTAYRALQQTCHDLEEWKRIILGTGTDQEAVIRLAATEYTKTAVQCWRDKVESLQQTCEELKEQLAKQGLEWEEDVADLVRRCACEINEYTGIAEVECLKHQAVRLQRDEFQTQVTALEAKYKVLVAFYDKHVGTPCEEILHKQEVDDLTQQLAVAHRALAENGYTRETLGLKEKLNAARSDCDRLTKQVADANDVVCKYDRACQQLEQALAQAKALLKLIAWGNKHDQDLFHNTVRGVIGSVWLDTDLDASRKEIEKL